MQKVQKGDTIKVHYKGTLNDGTQFDSSEGREPLQFTVGENMVIHGFDRGVLEMEIGDKKTIEIPFLEAYGPMNPEMIITVPRYEFPAELGELREGLQLSMVDQNGNEFPVEIIAIEGEAVTLDGNHPLAGKDLTFEIELVEII